MASWQKVLSGKVQWQASQYKLDNLCAVVDRNRLQISGNTEDVMAIRMIFTKDSEASDGT